MTEGKSEWNVHRVRQEFPMLQATMQGKPFVYLDSAATSQKPQCVIDAIRKFYAEEYATVHRSVYDFASLATERYDATRVLIKEFINATHVEEIIFTKGTTEAINLVASSFGRAFLEPGDEVLVTVMEHHSNMIPWRLICKERGAHLKFIPINDRAELILDNLDELLTSRTKILAVGHVSNATGTINPIEELIERAHAKGAKVLIDGAQAVAHTKVDVQKLDVDFYAFSSHKAYGPTGVGVLYGKKELLEQMPPYQSGGDMINRVSLESVTFEGPPLKFEAGTPLIAEVMGLGEAVRFLQKVGLDNIAAWEHELLEYGTRRLSEIPGIRFVGTAAKKAAIISFVIDDLHPLDVGTLLDLKGIAIRTGLLCAEPTVTHFKVPSLIRISFGMYNTLEEIDFLVESLKEAVLLLNPALSY